LAVVFFSSRRRHTRFSRDWSSDVCSSDLQRDTGNSDPYLGAGNVAIEVTDSSANIFCTSNTFGGKLLNSCFSYSYKSEFGGNKRSAERRVGKDYRSRWPARHGQDAMAVNA